MNFNSIRLTLLALFIGIASQTRNCESCRADYPFLPVANVHLTATNFWRPRLDVNRTVTVWHDLQQCEKTGRIDNFRKAAGLKEGFYQGLRFDDSDFYKVIEGASRVLAEAPDAKLDAALDELIAFVAQAQQPDGYIYTVMQVPHAPGEPVKGVVPGERWIHEQESHETYCMGHLIEAGVVHFKATGKRSLLDVAIKAADRLAADFGPGRIELPPGHQQVEIALAKLSKVTGEPQYLAMAEFFLEQRGRLSDNRRRLWSTYFQDHVPVCDQREAAGHAVRAAYQYMAMADVAALSGDQQYREVLRALWDNVASRKLYLTGGIGGGSGEGFSGEYDMPNLRAYNETCSSIANILWQQRMFQLEGDAKYIDILERCLYNSFLSGVSMEGDAFFYPNKLTSVAGHQRSPWFRCACCPPNVLRFIPQIPSLCYAVNKGDIFVNLYGSSEATVQLSKGSVRIVQESEYPWKGRAKFAIATEDSKEFTLALRVPGWLKTPFPSDLYRYADDTDERTPQVRVNGREVPFDVASGFAVVNRQWSDGDEAEIEFPMPIRKVVAHPRVESCSNRVALMRGPIVYAAEGPDNAGNVHNLVVPSDAKFSADYQTDLLGGVVTLEGEVESLAASKSGDVVASSHKLVAVPYYAWAHRGSQPMRVWLAGNPNVAWPTPADQPYARAKVTSSGRNPWTKLDAVNDQILPTSSSDNETPRFLWDRTTQAPVGAGTLEGSSGKQRLRKGIRWIQYDFPEPIQFGSSSVYWVTNDQGTWDTPQSIRLRYLDSMGDWQDIDGVAPSPAKDMLQEFSFVPIETSSLRLEVFAKPSKTVGLMEWIVK